MENVGLYPPPYSSEYLWIRIRRVWTRCNEYDQHSPPRVGISGRIAGKCSRCHVKTFRYLQEKTKQKLLIKWFHQRSFVGVMNSHAHSIQTGFSPKANSSLSVNTPRVESCQEKVFSTGGFSPPPSIPSTHADRRRNQMPSSIPPSRKELFCLRGFSVLSLNLDSPFSW